jgi:hypothetical protein
MTPTSSYVKPHPWDDVTVRQSLARIKADLFHESRPGDRMPYPRPPGWNWTRPDDRCLEDLEFLVAELEARVG